MDFRDFLSEEEKKVEKLSMCFIKDLTEKEVYVVTAAKGIAEPIVNENERYVFIAQSEALKLTAKGWSTMLFDLNRLKKHVAKELEDEAKAGK
jgi:hypothetical protein